jgi:hypothetical protein
MRAYATGAPVAVLRHAQCLMRGHTRRTQLLLAGIAGGSRWCGEAVATYGLREMLLVAFMHGRGTQRTETAIFTLAAEFDGRLLYADATKDSMTRRVRHVRPGLVVVADSCTGSSLGRFPGQPPANCPTTRPHEAEAVLKFELSAADQVRQCMNVRSWINLCPSRTECSWGPGVYSNRICAARH